ncbi:MAG: 16S rRNA processing protein RimM [Gemmatimonadaceae bacterium]|nr:16S rRNA processing protein RimM [Gemmatimonadaceae bacterium]
MRAPELIIVGRLRKAHGIRGALVVEPITDAPAEVYTAGRRLFAGTVEGDPAPDGAALTVAQARPMGDGRFIVRFAEIPDRTAAERWRDRYVLARADELTPPAEGEVYVHELLGMHVSLPTGESLGDVQDVYELPQGLMLDVAYGAESVLLPFREEFVANIDRAARRIVATPPEGLFE